MRFSHITFSLRCQYCISKIHFIHVAPSSYSYFKDRVDYLSETIVKELLFCHTILRANEFSLCLGKRKQRINACGEDIDRQHRNNFFSYLAAFLPTHNECFKNLIYLRPKAKYIFTVSEAATCSISAAPERFKVSSEWGYYVILTLSTKKSQRNFHRIKYMERRGSGLRKFGLSA